MPVGNLPGWHQIYADDFAGENYPLGSFSGCSVTGCTGTPGLPWGATMDGFHDTSGNCEYYPSQTVSISRGVMNIWMHTASNGVCMDANMLPLVPNLTYARYSIRFRADNVPGYRLVDLLWPTNGVSGEIDFPENQLNLPITGSLHPMAGSTNFQQFKSNVMSTGWNTATLQWTPTAVTFILNGMVIGTATTHVPKTPMFLNVRAASDLDAPKPPSSAAGNLQIAWLTVYSYAPTPTISSVTPSVVGQGDLSGDIVINGPGFTPGLKVRFSNPGLTVDGDPTLLTPNRVSVPVKVSNAAALGPTNVTVTEKLGTTTCPNCVTVAAGPDDVVAQQPAVAAQTRTVTVTGANFEPGMTVSANVPWSQVGAPKAVTATTFKLPVTVPGWETPGPYDLTVTNPNGGSTTCTGCLTVTNVPGAPTIGGATGGNGEAAVSFAPPASDGATPITSYAVTATDTTDPSAPLRTRSGPSSPITVTGLTNGNHYSFQVTAHNAVGAGPASARTGAVPATIPTPPQSVTATAGNARASVSFQPPTSDGGLGIRSYTVTATDATNAANGGQTVTRSADPITVTGLTNGDHYRFRVTANNPVGTSWVSASSNAVVPGTTPGSPRM
jgi:hypothetical protein